jgi:hypothetical protein
MSIRSRNGDKDGSLDQSVDLPLSSTKKVSKKRKREARNGEQETPEDARDQSEIGETPLTLAIIPSR